MIGSFRSKIENLTYIDCIFKVSFTKDITMSENSEIAYFAAGCFWGVEAACRQVNGVLSTAVGYQGGGYTESNL